MIRPIVTDPLRLNQPAKAASPKDRAVIQDLKDTLAANRERCVGMGANMIGANKRIIIVAVGPLALVMVNPVITAKTGAYQTMEGCLSLPGERPTTRYQTITVSYLDEHFKPQTHEYTDFTAQIIQHEVDHCDGILI